MLTFSFKDGKPLYEQLYQHIKNEIETGEIKAGEKLPSKRSLAANLKLSVVTVETAYGMLNSEGYIHSVPGSGYFAESLPGLVRPVAHSSLPCFSSPNVEHYDIDLRTNAVDPSFFPFSVWAKLSRELLSSGREELLLSCDGQGHYKLRQAIAQHLRSFRGMEVYPEQIVVGAGGEYLTGMLIQLLGREKVYGVEDPGYVKTQRIFSENCPNVVPIGVDESGAIVDQLIDKKVQIAHITPSHQFPMGAVMPAARRHQILSWCWDEEDRYIIEDDHDGDLRFGGRPVPSLQSLDRADRVLYLNSFTKSLAPSMRIGYMVVPLGLLKRYRERLGFYACTVPVFEQLTLAEFIQRGYFERHISRMRKVYLARRSYFIKALQNSSLSKRVDICEGNAGVHLMLISKTGEDEKTMLKKAADRGVRVYGLSEYYGLGGSYPGPARMIAGYGGLDEKEIDAAISALEQAWSGYLVAI